MIILGIDPGARFSGYSVFQKNNHQLLLLDYGVIALGAQKPLPERIAIFHEKIDLLVKKFNANYIALEEPFLGKNAQNFLKLGYLRGILYLIAQNNKINILEFAPRKIKCAVTGFGGASKEQVAFMVRKQLPHVVANVRTDVTDALAVGLCGVWEVLRFANRSHTGNIVR
jgi:crossover junction endodeoxyribonuclease RuvC